MWDYIKTFLRNRVLLSQVFLFQTLIALDCATILYVIVSSPDVYARDGWAMLQLITALAGYFITSFTVNLIYILLAFTRLRTTTILVPIIAASIGGIFMFIYSSSIFAAISAPLFIGALIGLIYSSMFYGPGIWLYFRMRMPFIGLGWISIIYLWTFTVVTSSAIDGKFDGALLRPDYLALTAMFYGVIALLLLLDNSQALARWRKTPSVYLKLPWRTIIPVILTIILVTIVSNVLSPLLWRAIWEQVEGEVKTESQQPGDQNVPEDAKDGPAGNSKQNEDGSVEMNPNQELQDEISMDGQGGILFTVKTDKDLATAGVQRFYWKMENLSAFTSKNGFHNDFDYDTTYPRDLSKKSYLTFLEEYWDTSADISKRTRLNQTVVMHDLKTNWLIGSQNQWQVRLLVGNDRDLYTFANNTSATDANKPLVKGDSYELESSISTVDVAKDVKLLSRLEYDPEVDFGLEEYLSFKDFKISELANQITTPDMSSAEKALAIQTYLLENYTYSLKPGTPDDLDESTAGLDRLNYFLFENKQGYCTYFASAMVALLRSEGIPSRVVGGFAQGEYDQKTDSYIVSGQYAHAWVEVYYPRFGWVTYDPTPESQAPEKTPNDENDDFKEDQKQIEENIKKALENKDKLDENIDVDVNPKTVDNKTFDQIAEFLDSMIRLIIPCMILTCGIIFFTFMAGLPSYNVAYEEYLAGKFNKRSDRDQIASYYKLLQLRLRKWNRTYAKKSHETSLEHAKRLYSDERIIKNEQLYKVISDAAEIYNRAVYRHEIKDTDRENMRKLTEMALPMIGSEMQAFRQIISYWMW